MPSLSRPLSQQMVIERLCDIADDDKNWYIVGMQPGGQYRMLTLLPDDYDEENQSTVAEEIGFAVATNVWGDYAHRDMATCTKWTVVHAPEFDCAAHDTFKWGAIAEALEAAEALDDDQNDDQRIKQIYLGSILHIVPSGQVRAPWSSAKACPLCQGGGTITNVLFDESQFRIYERLRSLLTKRNADKGLMFSDWSKEDQDEAARLDTHLVWCRHPLQCPFCRGDGSRVRVEDQDFMEYLEGKADEIGAFITGSEGDGCDVMIAKTCPQLEHDTDEDKDEEDEAEDAAPKG